MKCVLTVFLISIFLLSREAICGGGKGGGAFTLNDFFPELARIVFSDNSFKPYLTNLRPMLKTGNASLDIPILDPYEKDFQKINISNEILAANGNLTNVEVFGLSEYEVNRATFNVPLLKVVTNVTWPSIVVNSSYDLDANFMKIMNLSLYGEGDLSLELYNLTLDMTTWLELKDGKVFVKDMTSNVTLDQNIFYANGIYNSDFSSVIISDVITSWLPYVIENYPWVITDALNAQSTDYINYRYRDATLQNVIDTIGVISS